MTFFPIKLFLVFLSFFLSFFSVFQVDKDILASFSVEIEETKKTTNDLIFWIKTRIINSSI